MLQELETKILTDANVATITLSTAASDAVRNILTERNLEGYALRDLEKDGRRHNCSSYHAHCFNGGN